MSIYKREGSQFYWIRIEHKGQIVQESSGKTTRREAKLYEAQRRLELWPELEGGKEVPTLADFTRELFPYWRRECKERTRAYYVGSLSAVLEFPPIADAKLNEITPKLVERYKSHRAETFVDPSRRRNGSEHVGIVTINHSLRALRRALKLAAEVFEYRFTPPKVKLRKEPQRDYVVSEEDFQRFLSECGKPAEQISPTVKVKEGAGRVTMQALLTVLYDCGLRAGEAVRLTWDRANLDERWLFIDSGKTKAARRRVPLTSRVLAVLAGLKEAAKKDVPYVFTRHGGHQPITVGWASHEFCRIRRKLKLPDGCVLHSLRHSTATRLGNKGCSTGDLMKLMGWETPSIAVRYTHLDDARMEQIVGFLEVDRAAAAVQS